MKKFTFQRAMSFVLAFVMVFSVVVSGLPQSATVYAAKATPDQIKVVQTQLDAQKKQLGLQNQTTDKDKELKEELYKWAQERKEEEKARPTKEKLEKMEAALNIANEGVPLLINTIKDIADGGDFDTAEFVSGIADLASGILACIVPWGTVASIGLSLVKGVLMTLMGGDDGPSEVQLMEDRLNQRLDEIADQISEVQDQLSEMSDQINESTQLIISSVSSAIENESDKNHLRDFMLSSGVDDFSYNQLRNYLYGGLTDNRNAMTAYYAQLQEAQLYGGTSEQIKHYYDLLYSALVDSRTAFHDYITGDGFGKSIVQTYYDVLVNRPDLTAEMGMSAEMATVQFAYDLYQTELLMDQVILACNNYQYTQMAICGTSEYDYGTGTVLARDILNEQKESVIAKSLNTGIDELRMQFAEDLVYVMGVTQRYSVEQNGHIYYYATTEIDGAQYACVLENQTVYLNTVPASVSERFDLDAQAFAYTGKGLMDEDGIVQISYLNKDSAVTLLYTDSNGSQYNMGAIQFMDAENETFSGGLGTEDSPYLIATADQFLNIAEDMQAHYRLVKDISFSNRDINPIGYSINNADAEVYEEFNGVLDGDGFRISGLNIQGSIHSGLFGKIGSDGVVRNLTVSDINVTVSISEAKTTTSTFTGGVIAGTNNGSIYYCVVSDSSLTVTSSTDNADAERTVEFKYGGITGVNNGEILVAKVENSKVDVSSTHNFGGADTKTNKNHVFAGGVCGTCPGTLSYIGVDKEVSVKAYAKSILNPKSTVNPYVKAIAGGVTTNEGLKPENLSFVHSATTAEKVTASRELDAQSGWGEHYKNAKEESHYLIPLVSNDKLENICAEQKVVEDAFAEKTEYRVFVTDTTEKYPVGAGELNQGNLEITVNGEAVENFYVVNAYGFSSYNESYDNERTVQVTALFSAEVEGEEVMLTGTFPITVDKNQVSAIDVINYETNYRKGEAVQTTAMVDVWDANGRKTTETDAQITVANADTATAEAGTHNLEISYRGASCTVEIEVLCDIHYSCQDYSNPEHFTFVESVEADCRHGGYDAYRCAGCNEIIKTNRTGKVDHNRVREVSVPATCAAPGVIGKICCTYCDTVFEEQVELPRLAHNIVHVDNADNHYCTQCEKYYAHDYVVSESLVDGKVTYTYTCYSCGYVGQKQDTNIITNEERLRPAVVVSDGFATKGGDLVTVYVDLENNPGVNGANFGIRYDERLELVQWYEGSFFAGTTTEASHAVSCGYNYVWGTETARTDKGGNLLQLVFRLPEDAEASDSYEVAVVYSVVAGSEGGFALPNDVCATLGIPSNHPQKFKTKDGVIRIVDRLPGDVDNNRAVNLMDALYLSNCLVNQEQYPITNEVKHYGDVNLDASVTINDVVKVLQSISGGYGASLMSPEYRIQLNTNGYTYRPEALFVQLYGANNTYAALAEIQQDMEQREGYKFLGWYTRLEGGVRIDAENYRTTLVSYDQDQKIQTLYAHWQKNSVSFEMNGATSETLDKETYLGNGEQNIILPEPVEEYTVIFVDPDKASNRKTEIMSRKFAYWQGSDGNKYYAGESFPVHKLNMGELTLTAQWEDWELNFPTLEKTGYDSAHIIWHTNAYLTDRLEGDVYEAIRNLPEKVLYAEWTAPITYYVHYDANGGTGNMADSTHTYDVSGYLSDNAFSNKYSVTFDFGWEGQSGTSVSVTHSFLGWSRDGKTVLEDKEYSNWSAENGKVITVYALWDEQYVTLPAPNARTGYTFQGWYTDADFTVFAGQEATFATKGACTLYAKWKPNEYTVVYGLNPMGSSNAADGNSDQCRTTPTWKDQSHEDRIIYGVTGTYLDVPTTDHYEFVGWYTAPVGGTKITDSSGKVVKADAFLANNSQLYAHWTPSYSGTYVYDEAGLRNISSSGTYHIIKDITLTSAWTPISAFNGTIDGHNHTISNLSCVKSGITTASSYGFIVNLNAGATVKNLTFNSATVTADYIGYDTDKDVAVGCVAAINNGTIDNVKVINSTLKIDSAGSTSSKNAKRNYAIVGGICGYNNSGIVSNCSVDNVTVYAHARTSRGIAFASAGGLVGKVRKDGQILNASASNYNVQSYAYDPGGTDKPQLESAAGGIVGSWIDGAAVTVKSMSGTQYVLADYDGDAIPRTRYYHGNNGGSYVYGYKGAGMSNDIN